MPRRGEECVLVLNARPLWVRLLFRALGRFVPTKGVVFNLINGDVPISEAELEEAVGWQLRSVELPRRSFGRMAPLFAPWIRRRLELSCGRPGVTIFTQPTQRSLCRHFAHTRRIYYVADDYRWGYGWAPNAVESWERIIVANVEKVVCVSNTLADSFHERLQVERERLHVSASGMPARMIPKSLEPVADRPESNLFADRRPLAGVLGTIDNRIRLDWLRGLIDTLPWLNLLLVGPIAELESDQLADWAYLHNHPRCIVVGEVEYYELFKYAAAIDIGLIPLSGEGINPGSSPTRLYTQLPFGKPIVASSGSQQLRELEPLVWIAETPQEFTQKVHDLRCANFDDGMAPRRHAAAHEHTWERRAESFYQDLVAG